MHNLEWNLQQKNPTARLTFITGDKCYILVWLNDWKPHLALILIRVRPQPQDDPSSYRLSTAPLGLQQTGTCPKTSRNCDVGDGLLT